MSYTTGVVHVDTSLFSSNVLVDSAVFSRLLASGFSGESNSRVPLEIVVKKRSFYVGCEKRNLDATSKNYFVFPSYLANYCGVLDNDLIRARVLLNLPIATKVFVSPNSVDECEVVEKNAMMLEECLHLQLFVVSPGMPVKLFFNGVKALVKINEVESKEGTPLTSGGALLGSGTQVLISVMQRTAEKKPSEEQSAPQWAIMRSIPRRNGDCDCPSMIVELEPTTASQRHWKEGSTLNVLDLKTLLQLKEPEVNEDFLLGNGVSLEVAFSKDVPPNCCRSPFSEPTNLWLSPPTKRILSTANVNFFSSNDDCKVSQQPSWKEVCEVHGETPQALLRSLRFSFQSQSEICNGNVLVFGGKGYGKSTMVAVTLQQLDNIHVVRVDCTTQKEFLETLRKSMQEAILCAPSVVFLDNFDVIAPSQKEGNVPAMSDGTIALLQGMLRNFSTTFSLVPKGVISIVATCLCRDSLNERFRSASFFPVNLVISPLVRLTRQCLLKQCIPSASKEEISKISGLLENYTSYDISHFSARLLNSMNANKNIVDQAQTISLFFTPLAHSGINFLKGKKVSWESIGGLKKAKKLLYETLVLPLRHPEIFSKLPLKIRSGILLYGPSGCGKTFIVESLVNAENLNCLVVNGPEVFGKYIGESEQKIRDVFERAQAASPCIVFFDEFDSVAPQRGLDNSGVTDRVVNQLLCYLDGVESRKDVFVVAASSRPDLIDAALLRPGRLDVAVACPIPSSSERKEILCNLLQNVSTSLTEKDVQELVDLTPNWTPADLAAMVSSANTAACQKVFTALPSCGSFAANSSTESAYFIADIASSTSVDKIKDNLKVLTSDLTDSSEAIARIEITMDDLQGALQSTRPSLSQKDIRSFERIEALFSKGQSVVPKNSNTKLTTK